MHQCENQSSSVDCHQKLLADQWAQFYVWESFIHAKQYAIIFESCLRNWEEQIFRIDKKRDQDNISIKREKGRRGRCKVRCDWKAICSKQVEAKGAAILFWVE